MLFRSAQGGKVAVTSRLGFGSTFYAWLPWVPAPAAENPDPPASADRTENRVSPGVSRRVPA